MPLRKVGPALGVMLLVAAGSGPAMGQDLAPAGLALTVYVNGAGGVVHAGTDDPAAMRSDIVALHGQQAIELPAFEGTRAEWTGMMACVQGHFAGLPVRIVDRAPAGADHLMIMVGGRPEHTGSTDGEWGRAPMAEGAVSPRGVAFAFSAAMRFERTAAMCQTVAHEVGHMLGLDHRQDCADLMNGNPCGLDGLAFTPSARRAMATAIAAHLGARLEVLEGDTPLDHVEAAPAEVDPAEGEPAEGDPAEAADAPLDPYHRGEPPAPLADADLTWGDPFGTLELEDAGQAEADAAAPAGCGAAQVDEPAPLRRPGRSWRHQADRADRADGRHVRWRVRVTVQARRRDAW